MVQPGPYQPGPYYPPPAYYPPQQGYAPYYNQGYYPPPPGYYPYAPYYPPPMRVPPPVRRHVVVKRQLACPGCVAQERARYFSIGVRFSVLGINQQIAGQDVTLMGVGLQARFRTSGRFGMEATLDFLHGQFGADPSASTATTYITDANGMPRPTAPVFGTPGPSATRDTIPFTLSALFYIFKNTDARIFNLYFLGGAGLYSTDMGLVDENGHKVTQGFTEYEAHLGVGAELRFHWFALDANVRGLGLWRDDSSAPASYYSNVEGAPVPKNSWGYQGTLAATLWF
jgi:hypothetical protein